ncbi:haloacid dehalogenase-like hydrolase [Candidatus Uhrbacteria bacterium]|nr:haloacid dehalogenase-like hydrolase [Candidatus Uhrbacteria bacterium]
MHELMSRAARVRNGCFDFDGTLHTGNTWAAVGRRLPETLREQDAAIRTWYWDQLHTQVPQRSLDDPDWFHGHLPAQNQAVVDGAWVANDVHWYMEAGLTRDDFEAVAQELVERPGASDLLQLMRHRVVITFGIEQVVQRWLRDRNISAAVAGTRLTFNEVGRLTGHHPNVVASTTKEHAARRFCELCGSTKDETLVIGDSVVDVHMMGPTNFNVLVVPPSEIDRKLRDFRENSLSAMWDRVTMILADDSLEPLVALLRDARENT